MHIEAKLLHRPKILLGFIRFTRTERGAAEFDDFVLRFNFGGKKVFIDQKRGDSRMVASFEPDYPKKDLGHFFGTIESDSSSIQKSPEPEANGRGVIYTITDKTSGSQLTQKSSSFDKEFELDPILDFAIDRNDSRVHGDCREAYEDAAAITATLLVHQHFGSNARVEHLAPGA